MLDRRLFLHELAMAVLLAAPACGAASDWDGFSAGGEAARRKKEEILGKPTPEAVRSLSLALGSPDASDTVRFWAVQTLGDLALRLPAQQEAIKAALALAQSDANVEVRFAAALGLSGLCDPRGERTLLATLSGADPLRQVQALDALQRVGGKDAVGALIEILPHPDREVRAKAFWTLAAITGQPIGKKVLLSDAFPDFTALPTYQELKRTLSELRAQISQGPINKDELGQHAARVESQLRKIISDEIGRSRTQFFLDVQEAALQWKQWLAEHKDEDASVWLLSGLANADADVCALSLDRLRAVAGSSAVAKLLAFADDAKAPSASRLKAIATAAALMEAKQVPEWLDRLDRAAKAAAGAGEATEARLEAYRSAAAYASGLTSRTGASYPPEGEAWRSWWKRAGALPGFGFGTTLFLPGADPGVELAVILPPSAGAEPIPATIGRWDPKAAKWTTEATPLKAGEPAGKGAFATGHTLKRVASAAGEKGVIWELEGPGGRQRQFHAR